MKSLRQLINEIICWKLKQFSELRKNHKNSCLKDSYIFLSDSCKYLRGVKNADWLFDTIHIYQIHSIMEDHPVQIWEIKQIDQNVSTIECRNEKGNMLLPEMKITTSFRLNIVIYVMHGLAMLQTEYKI